jgi:CheY-like chemotaxis protein
MSLSQTLGDCVTYEDQGRKLSRDVNLQTLVPPSPRDASSDMSRIMKSHPPSKAASTHDCAKKRPGQSTRHREPAAQPSRGYSRPGKCILLVDDDTTVRESLNDVLVSEGYVVIPAENGQQALDLANQSPVDLVLLDLNMPVKNGWDTFEPLTREHPLIPIIIITARPNQLFTSLSAGAGALLEKPMDIPMLLRTIAKLLAESADERLARLAGKKAWFYYQSPAARR